MTARTCLFYSIYITIALLGQVLFSLAAVVVLNLVYMVLGYSWAGQILAYFWYFSLISLEVLVIEFSRNLVWTATERLIVKWEYRAETFRRAPD
jgi:phosphate starvation-inducible membrane PsiE